MIPTRSLPLFVLTLSAIWSMPVRAQDPPPVQRPPGADRGFAPGGTGPGGMGGPGGPMGQETKAVAQFDADKNGRLDETERKAARAWLAENRPQRGRGPGGGPGGGRGGPPGGPEGGGRERDPNAKGATVAPGDVASYPDKPLFDTEIVRTIFVVFPGNDWIEELSAFYRTDVAVPATVTVDGKTYRDVGTGFRGNTSYQGAHGHKKSWDFAFDHADAKQSLHGVRNLDLINCNGDASFLRECLHGWASNQFFPAPRVCLVRLVVNGEDHGVYAAVQQFDKEFLQDHFGSKQGDRFKVPPDFSGNGGLRWLGEDPKAYARNYQIKSKENDAAWAGLVDLCAVLENTPADQLERILPQHLDVDGALWFLAVDNALADDDGYHSRASDYLLYRDPKGRFHLVPRDNNEVLLAGGARGPRPGGAGGIGQAPAAPAGQGAGGPPPDQGPGGQAGPGGPGARRGGGPGGAASSPLQMAERADRPLLSKLLQVPAWRQRYLANLHELATTALSDEIVGARIETWRAMIDKLVAADAHSLLGYEAFQRSFAKDDQGKPAPRSLLAVIAQRRSAILQDPALQGSWPLVANLVTKAQLGSDGQYTLHVACRVDGCKVSEVRVHHDVGVFGSYATAVMRDDGQSGDGAAGDGTYAFSLPAVPAGETWRFWIEAIAADSGHVDCLPPSGGAIPAIWVAPKKAK